MSKTTVQKATPKTAPTSLPPAPAKAAKKVAPAKKAAKASPLAVAKTASKAKHAPAAKSATAAAVKPAPASKTTPAPRSVPVAVTPAPRPVAAVAQVASAVTPAPVKPRSRSSSKALYIPVQAPLPLPTSRFADRFAPPRPPTRHMSKPELESPKHIHKHDPKLANAWKAKSAKDLSEPELLAMPDVEYMNDKQLEFFRLKLQQLKDDLLNNAGETTEHLREDTSIVPDPADRATIEEEHALELRTRDRERKLLKKISQSLTRIESGEYGFCDETGEPIGLGRLIARPTATLSLEAQQRRELKQKLFGD